MEAASPWSRGLRSASWCPCPWWSSATPTSCASPGPAPRRRQPRQGRSPSADYLRVLIGVGRAPPRRSCVPTLLSRGALSAAAASSIDVAGGAACAGHSRERERSAHLLRGRAGAMASSPPDGAVGRRPLAGCGTYFRSGVTNLAEAEDARPLERGALLPDACRPMFSFDPVSAEDLQRLRWKCSDYADVPGVTVMGHMCSSPVVRRSSGGPPDSCQKTRG